MEQFIERGTDYELEHGLLSVYETNCACRDVKFFFKQHVLTLMLSGHKTVVSDHLKLEFFPGTLFIPEQQTVQTVAIPNATLDNPTKCLVLDVNPAFLNAYWGEVFPPDEPAPYALSEEWPRHYLSNDVWLIRSFKRLYEHQLRTKDRKDRMIGTLLLKELLLRVFQTPGGRMLMGNATPMLTQDKQVQKGIAHIRDNLGQKITIAQLCRVSGLGPTTLYHRFKDATGKAPVEYILCERMELAKILIQKDEWGLKRIAFHCGFNSYEYFCTSFKKMEGLRPSDYRVQQSRTQAAFS